MNTSTRRSNESLWRRLWHAWKHVPDQNGLQSSDDFQIELVKEISRSNRRQHAREFALVHLACDDKDGRFQPSDNLVTAFRTRLRITDTVGWHSSNLAVLLPETDREGGMMVANELMQLGAKHGVRLDSMVYIYPWDDELISVSNEIASSQTKGRANEVEDNGSSGRFERQDSVHGAFVRSGNRDVRTEDDNDTPRGSCQLQLEERAYCGDPMSRAARPSSDQGSIVMVAEKPITSGTLKKLATPKGVVANTCLGSRSTLVIRTVPTPWWKRAIDIVGAGVGLIVLSPILIGAAVAIKATSPGPVLFRQKREGQGGRHFDILKFRTMIVDAESKQASLRQESEQDGPAFKLKDDPRVTLIGKTLRKSCIDELPQLVNVLVGEMSLVGPRPLPVFESTECRPWQRMRLTVLPGLTCTWQARGGRTVTFEQWMRMDLDYINNRSFLNDMRLILETAMVVVMQRGSV